MANSLRRSFTLATMILAITFAGTRSQEPDDSSGAGGSATTSTPGVLPAPDPATSDSGPVDVSGHPVTKGLVGMLPSVLWPFKFTGLQALNFILRNVLKQELPCTIWSIVPPKVQCTMMQPANK